MEELDVNEPQSLAPGIIPEEQATISFYGKPLLVVRLPDGRPGVVVRSLCDNLQLDRIAQIRRIQRTEAIADDLVANVLIDTDGGPQRAHILVLHAVAYWLATIDAKRVRDEARPDVVKYQKEAVDVLYAWAQQPRSLPALTEPQAHVSSTLIAPIVEPGPEATHREHAAYHELMSVYHRHQADLHAQAWREEVDARITEHEERLEAREAVTDLIPEIIERLGPEKLTQAHRKQVKAYVQQLSKATGKHWQTIYLDLYTAFEVAQYEDILEADWQQVVNWFTVQLERGRGNQGKLGR